MSCVGTLRLLCVPVLPEARFLEVRFRLHSLGAFRTALHSFALPGGSGLMHLQRGF